MSTDSSDLTHKIRRALVALAAMALAGLPVTFGLASVLLGPGQVWPAVASGGWVIVVAIAGLLPLWVARTGSPAQQINARLGHVLLRLFAHRRGADRVAALPAGNRSFTGGRVRAGVVCRDLGGRFRIAAAGPRTNCDIIATLPPHVPAGRETRLNLTICDARYYASYLDSGGERPGLARHSTQDPGAVPQPTHHGHDRRDPALRAAQRLG